MEPNSSTVKKAESPQEKLSPMEKWSASRMKFLAQEKLKMSNEESSELKSSPTPAEQTTPACTECQELNKTMQCMIGDNLYGFHDLADIKELLPKVIRHHKENLKYLLGDEGDAHARFKIMEEIESRRSWWDGLNYKMDDYIEDEKSHVSFLEGQLKNVAEMEKSFNGFEPMFHRFGKLIASFKYTRQEEDRSQMLCFVGSCQFGFHDTKQVVEFLVTSIEDMHYQLRHKQVDPIQTRTELGAKVKAKMAYDVRIMKRDVAYLEKCLRYLNQLNMKRSCFANLTRFLYPDGGFDWVEESMLREWKGRNKQ